ncbi:putative transposase [Nocardia nova SH22a]|uniref:Putative transposase n=1 Tax=Nocardia nova SH22a TaxID=1415166 RepID=W5TLR9_9NOCA|nr:putative transposase [Nocardia nova SH22a]
MRQNVSAVARELGFVRITCYKWAHQAGIFTGKSAEPPREEFLRLRRAGRSPAEAAAAVGADKRSAQDWDKGIRVFYGGRVYPDGRVVRYRQDQILAGVKSPRGSYRQQDRIDLERVERVIDRRYLSLVERERLHDLRRTGMTIRAIAAAVGRSPSTISRELRRNTNSARGYMPHSAHRESVRRRARSRKPKLLTHDELREYVRSRLRRRWSPEQISHRLIKDFPDRPDMRVATETVYQSIYVHLHGKLKRELAQQLRRGRLRRKTRKDPNARRRRSSTR